MKYESGHGCKFKESHNMVFLVFQESKVHVYDSLWWNYYKVILKQIK